MKNDVSQYAKELKKNKTGWCYPCDAQSVEWNGRKFVCHKCHAEHSQIEGSNID